MSDNDFHIHAVSLSRLRHTLFPQDSRFLEREGLLSVPVSVCC